MKILALTLLFILSACSSAPMVKNVYYDKDGKLMMEKCRLGTTGWGSVRLDSCRTVAVGKEEE